MNHIIALPYWCEKETQNFLQVFTRWELFCKTDVSYSFLLVRRFDAKPSIELFRACEKHAPTTELVCDKYPWTGWPAGANGMFKNTMEHVFKTKPLDGGFVFWFEHDVVPIHIDWLTWLDKLWQPELILAGQFMSLPWINLHQAPMPPNINGTAMYSKTLATHQVLSKISPDVCFDFVMSEHFPKNSGKALYLPLLYDTWFFMPDWVKRCDLTKLMINGIKELNQRETVIQYILKNRDS